MKKNRSTNSRINKIEKNRVKDVHRNQSQTCFVRGKTNEKKKILDMDE